MESKNFVQAFYAWYSHTLRNTKYRWLIIVATVLYLFSPFDIAPDFIPIVGLIDDGLVATLLVTELSKVFLEQLKLRSRRSSNSAVDNTKTNVADIPSTIDVDVN